MLTVALLTLLTVSPDVALLTASPTEDLVPELEAQLSAALAQRGVTLVDLSAQLDEVNDTADEGQQIRKEARSAYDELDYETSAQRWKLALEFYLSHPEHAHAHALAEAHFFSGALMLLNASPNHLSQAKEEFTQALTYEPDFSFDVQLFDKKVQTIFERVRADMKERPIGALTLEVPKGSVAVVDHQELRALSAVSLPIGRHLVRVSKRGYEPYSQIVDLTPAGASVRPSLKRQPTYAAVLRQGAELIREQLHQRGPLPNAAQSLAQQLQVRFLILANQETASVWDTVNHRRLSELKVAPTALKASASAIADFMEAPSTPGLKATSSTQPLTQTWWFWAAVGVAVVGGATAVGIASSQGQRPYDLVLQIP